MIQFPEAELAADSILPEQFVDRSFSGARIQPEKRLQLAVLTEAVAAFRRCADVPGPRARRLLAEVETWFASDEADGPFTFVGVCDSLGFDPTYVRRGLREWRADVDAAGTWALRRDGTRLRHRVVLPWLRRVA